MLLGRFKFYILYIPVFFQNRINESFIFFEDTVWKLRTKEVFLFISGVFLRLLQQLEA